MEKLNVKGFEFVPSNFKLGFSFDRKEFCILTERDITIYSELDEFLKSLKSFVIDIQKMRDGK